jgi:ferredoxin
MIDVPQAHDGAQRYRRGPVQRWMHHGENVLLTRIAPLLAIFLSKRWNPLFTRLPYVPTRWVRRLRSPAVTWTDPVSEPPGELRTVAGIRSDPQAAQEAFERAPLHDFFHLHHDALVALVPIATLIAAEVRMAPRLRSATGRLVERQDVEPDHAPVAMDPKRLTADLKVYAATLGISATGITALDPKYTFAEHAGKAAGDRAVVCVLEQNYDATQAIPAHKSEQAALAAYGQLEDRMVALSEWLRKRGWRARPEAFEGESMFIPHAVAAGLGQLGLNGQLLTPHAGSRVRLNMLTTNAPLVLDRPVDYGIEGVCDRCQICVRRCPVGAIPGHRREHRGVTKAKLNTKRCLPLLMATSGCSICMKVCPVQRFGLPAVLDEYQRSGRILGKDTDDLEGFDWPLDGRHYGPGEKPRVPDAITQPPGFHFDPARTEPPRNATGLRG